ncbi:hypothetical protein ACFQ9X_15880 [Catenulispora yoronensis]
MDLTSVVTPGAQSLVTSILTDSWKQVLPALSRLWARHRSGSPGVVLEEVGAELDLAREQAISITGDGSESERARRMELFWAGYLAGQLAARPELAGVVQELPALLGAAATAAPTAARPRSRWTPNQSAEPCVAT